VHSVHRSTSVRGADCAPCFFGALLSVLRRRHPDLLILGHGPLQGKTSSFYDENEHQLVPSAVRHFATRIAVYTVTCLQGTEPTDELGGCNCLQWAVRENRRPPATREFEQLPSVVVAGRRLGTKSSALKKCVSTVSPVPTWKRSPSQILNPETIAEPEPVLDNVDSDAPRVPVGFGFRN
jgi:hypothetical protein